MNTEETLSELNRLEEEAASPVTKEAIRYAKVALTERPRAKWEVQEDNPYSEYDFRCSRCGELGNDEWSFCPYCGSRMMEDLSKWNWRE